MNASSRSQIWNAPHGVLKDYSTSWSFSIASSPSEHSYSGKSLKILSRSLLMTFQSKACSGPKFAHAQVRHSAFSGPAFSGNALFGILYDQVASGISGMLKQSRRLDVASSPPPDLGGVRRCPGPHGPKFLCPICQLSVQILVTTCVCFELTSLFFVMR